MITRVFAKNFKGQTFDQPLYGKNIFIGLNGSGKSSRSQALVLAYFGHTPESGKRPIDIHKAFASDRKVTVGFEYKGVEYERSFAISENGSVTQLFRIDKKKAGKDEFAIALASIPKIIDLSVFLSLSDQKMIDHIFTLFPPAGDVRKLDQDIEALKNRLNLKQADIRVSAQTIAKLTKSRSEIELPSGNLAEVQASIEELLQKTETARNAIKEAEKEKAAADATKKAEEAAEKKAAENQAKVEAEAKAKAEADLIQRRQEAERSLKERNLRMGIGQKAENTLPEMRGQLAPPAEVYQHNSAQSIQAILHALETAGCSACAAILVAKKELKKYTLPERKVA